MGLPHHKPRKINAPMRDPSLNPVRSAKAEDVALIRWSQIVAAIRADWPDAINDGFVGMRSIYVRAGRRSFSAALLSASARVIHWRAIDMDTVAVHTGTCGREIGDSQIWSQIAALGQWARGQHDRVPVVSAV